ncbi:MAG TPA: hypothetical protein VE967_02220 [Gemmatimonadaceae bacterium]|nr:hypothetical protein [Gemmatimonadaceae bacterium]
MGDMRYRHLILSLVLAVSASPLAAQRRVRRPPPLTPMLQSLTVDVASAFDERYRAMIEPLVFGRFSVTIAGEYTRHGDDDVTRFAYPVDDCPPERLCAGQNAADYGFDGNNRHFREWAFEIGGRWYPKQLTFANARQAASFYAGEYIGYRQRRRTDYVYYGCPTCNYYPPPRADSGTAFPPDSGVFTYPPPSPSTYTTTIHAWEPGAEIGVRIIPARHVVLDVGGRFRMVRLRDYTNGNERGDIDSKLLVAVGIGW